jgi:hypothetical protein
MLRTGERNDDMLPNNRWRGRERLLVTRRGRGKTVRACGASPGLLHDRSTSPLDAASQGESLMAGPTLEIV